MKAKKMLWLIAPLALGLAMGCAKKADINKPVDQIQAEVQKMSAGDLEKNARAYAKEIAAKKGDIEKVKEQLKGISVKDLFGEKAKGIKDQVSRLGNELGQLSERYDIYAKKFAESGGDLSKIKID